MSSWSVLWLLWIALFFLIELPAAFNKQKGDTLSEHVWKWFAVRPQDKHAAKFWALRRIFLLAFMAWLSIHFIIGGAWV